MPSMILALNFVKSFFDIYIGHNINVIRQTVCMVVNPITARGRVGPQTL